MAPARKIHGLAAFEAILLLLIVAAGFALLAGQAESARSRLRQDLATRQLTMLREALIVYHLDTGSFPGGASDLSAAGAFTDLQTLPTSGRILLDWPSPSKSRPADEPADPWRSTYRYIAADNDTSGKVGDNGGWPLFLSAGPDRDFGDGADPAAQTDNRGSNELLARRPAVTD